MTFTEQLIADLCDADRKDLMDLEERTAYGVWVDSDGAPTLVVADQEAPTYDPFERDQTYKED